MPELPEVETVVRGLRPALEGATIARVEARRPDLRFPLPERLAARLEGRRVEGLTRRAKFILAAIEGGETLLAHLGMTGRFTVERPGAGLEARDEPGAFYHEAVGRDRAHDHLVFHLSGGTRIVYNDARRFGFLRLVPAGELEAHPHLSGLGPEPLDGAFDGAALAVAMAGRRAPLKAALLDQRRVAGLGNIYVCEALHRAGLDPSRPAGTLADAAGAPTPAAHRLAAEIGAVLREAVEAGGSTLRDYANAEGGAGAFQHRFRAYGREGEPCLTPGCGGMVARVVQGGRSTFWCPGCQG